MNARIRSAVVATAIIMVMLLGATPALAQGKDRNRNGIPDWWETKHHMNLRTFFAHGDFDRDGLKNIDEFRSGTSPRKADTDGDGIRDGQEDPDGDQLNNLDEVKCWTNPLVADTDADGITDAMEDPDRDHLLNAQELYCGTNPLRARSCRHRTSDGDLDSDRDGLTNCNEYARACDPRDRDSDDDGVIDGREVAGYVRAYDADSGVLTIVAPSADEHTYAITLDDDTTLEWADGVTADAAPTLADLRPGATVSDICGATQSDGTVLATKIKLVPAPLVQETQVTDAAIAIVSWFDDGQGRLGLRGAEDNFGYEVLVDENTEYAWATTARMAHAASAADLVAGAALSDLGVTPTADGELLANRIVLIPNYVAPPPAADNGATATD